jgi:acyl carrier protein
MTRADVVQRIRSYVDDNFLYAPGSGAIADDDSLLTLGVIDSLGVMELLLFIEQEYGIVAADDEITEHNLGSFAGIADYVVGKSVTALEPAIADRAS